MREDRRFRKSCCPACIRENCYVLIRLRLTLEDWEDIS